MPFWKSERQISRINSSRHRKFSVPRGSSMNNTTRVKAFQYGWVIALILTICYSVQYMDRLAMGYMANEMIHDLNMTAVQFGQGLFLMLVVYGPMQGVVGTSVRPISAQNEFFWRPSFVGAFLPVGSATFRLMKLGTGVRLSLAWYALPNMCPAPHNRPLVFQAPARPGFLYSLLRVDSYPGLGTGTGYQPGYLFRFLEAVLYLGCYVRYRPPVTDSFPCV